MPKNTTFISLDAAAEYYGVHPRTIRRRIAEGAIPAFRVGGGRQIRVRVSDLDAALSPVTHGQVMPGA